MAAGMGHLSPDELDKMLEDEEDIGVLSDFFAKPKGTQIMAKCKVGRSCPGHHFTATKE